MMKVFEPGTLNYITFSRPILLTLSVFRNPILTHLPPSGFLDSLLCVPITPTPGLAFYLLMPRTLAVLSFSSGRTYLSLNFLPPLFLRLIPTLIMLQNPGSDYLPILLSVPLSPVSRPNERSPFFNFQKARWDGFASYFGSHCPSAKKYSSLSLSSAAALFISLALNAAKSFIPFGHTKRPPKAWWSAEVQSAVGERRKTFAAAHRSDVDRQAYISASRRTLSVIAKPKTEAWQTTCSSLSPISNPKTVNSLLRSIPGSPSSSSSSPSFPNCSSPRKSASI